MRRLDAVRPSVRSEHGGQEDWATDAQLPREDLELGDLWAHPAPIAAVCVPILTRRSECDLLPLSLVGGNSEPGEV